MSNESKMNIDDFINFVKNFDIEKDDFESRIDEKITKEYDGMIRLMKMCRNTIIYSTQDIVTPILTHSDCSKERLEQYKMMLDISESLTKQIGLVETEKLRGEGA